MIIMITASKLMNETTRQMKIYVGITGASGAIYGIRAAEMLENTVIQTHLLLSDAPIDTPNYHYWQGIE